MARDSILRVRLDDQEWAQLDNLARALGIRRSTVVRRLVTSARVSDKPHLEVCTDETLPREYAEVR